MPIISVSLTDKNVEDLETLQKELGFTGRSEAVRAAMRTLMAESNERRSMAGLVDGVLILVNDACASGPIHDIYHDNHPLIKTHVHNHLGNDKCMNMMVLSGEASDINVLLDQMFRLDGIAYLKFIRS
ncbi:MAG: CopG family ribbon-helix-helix protein [Methanomassiliicoccales archaeon]|nr:CopG family ribbon-helix-helix protein [Methanomassiliicoccales archaeon]TFG57136.1 MAG: CopG family ribbon-helix-helix protein [Methanomassiliicoccus sp.]